MFIFEIKENDVIKNRYEIEILFKKRTYYNKFQYFVK